MRKYTRNFWVRLKPIEGGIKVGVEKKIKQNIYLHRPNNCPNLDGYPRMPSFVHYHRILLCSSKSVFFILLC